jgi:hypothetical protein
MCRLAAEPDLYIRLGSAASSAVREEFEHGKQIEKLESCYDEARELFRTPGAQE